MQKTKIKSDIPFPKPNSEISSPNQTARTVPAVIVKQRNINWTIVKLPIIDWDFKSAYIPKLWNIARGTVKNLVY